MSCLCCYRSIVQHSEALEIGNFANDNVCADSACSCPALISLVTQVLQSNREIVQRVQLNAKQIHLLKMT